MRSTALGWIDLEVSTAPEWEAAQLVRFARRLGYRIEWPDKRSLLPVADQVRAVGIDAVLVPGLDHLGPLELNRVMDVADVEMLLPRLSFARWSVTGTAQ